MAKKKEKTYKVPQEVKKMNTDYHALIELRDKYIERPFGLKKAIKCSKKAVRLRNKLWDTIYEIYPNLRKYGGGIYFSSKTETVIMDECPKPKAQ